MSISISSSAMLVDLSIGTWTARKLDRSVTDEVNSNKKASKSASRVNKNLLPEVKQLDRINKFVSATRKWMYQETLPWSDYGPRLIPTAKFFDFKRKLDEAKTEFEDMVQDFLTDYPTLISAQAFELGDMFNRDEYPSVDSIASRFNFRASFIPVPESGDFRVDIGDEAAEELRTQYEQEYMARYENALADIRSRIAVGLKHLSERFTDNDDGNRKRFNNDILERFIETLSTVRALNLTNDPQIAKIIHESEWAVANVDVEEVRDSKEIRKDVRNRVDSILETFDF
jgi:hypothetical protein